MVSAAIKGFRTPAQDSSGMARVAWEKPGDTVRFELTAEVHGDPNAVKAEVWTNANHNHAPDRFAAVPMKVEKVENGQATYRVDLPLQEVGNFRAVGRVSTDGGQSWEWMGKRGIGDVRFRVRDDAHDALNIELLNVGMANYDPAKKRFGTFADLMESGSPTTNGKYTLEWLASQGVTALWMQPIFEVSRWDKSHPADDAGSPYAAKSFFSVRKELTRAANGLEGEAADKAATAEFKAFKQRCEQLGIKLIMDVALNHVGHNHEFSDLFVSKNAAGQEVREVRKNDYSQVAVNPEQLGAIQSRLAEMGPKGLAYMEYVAPHMYGKYQDTRGATKLGEMAPGGWFEWDDVKQLNHGRMRHGYSWWDPKPSTANDKVLGWLERVLRFWAVDMGIDGFRIDHLTGMPERFLEETMNRVQADVDDHTPGRSIFLVGEDFHTGNLTRHWLDANQGGWFHALKKVHDADALRGIIEHPWFHDLVALGSHDEARFIHEVGGAKSAGRLLALIQLVGGPAMTVIGDEFGEQQQLRFKQRRGVPALKSANGTARGIAETKGAAGRARKALAALRDDNRWFLDAKQGHEKEMVALARWADDPKQSSVFVFANFRNDRSRSNSFSLAGPARERIEPNAKYQVFDHLGKPAQGLWAHAKKGSELLEKGLYAALGPYQVQVLELRKVG